MAPHPERIPGVDPRINCLRVYGSKIGSDIRFMLGNMFGIRFGVPAGASIVAIYVTVDGTWVG